MNKEFSYVLEKLKERRTQMVEFLSNGSIADIAEYKRLCGVIQGLDFASDVVTDLATRMEQQDDE